MEPSWVAAVAEGEVAIQGVAAARDPAAAAANGGGRGGLRGCVRAAWGNGDGDGRVLAREGLFGDFQQGADDN